MPYIGIDKIKELQKSNYFTRNICILAHVDHGKTTLADSLIASNGIISQKLAGKLRYMDSREDEQIRGITMKSSSISLHYQGYIFQNDFLINLIDSPGHVDFASEVSTAVRLCDGAIVVVDVVEGVCAQTRVWLQQAYQEQLKPILVLNKIDRLILEKQMTPLDAYYHLMQLLEQINAVMGNIFASDVMANEVKTSDNDCISALEDSDDSNIYFCPTKLNVIFASAIDGWAFILSDFAQMYESKLGPEHSGIRKEQLVNVLWGDFFYSTKDKFYKSGAQEHGRKPMFVQFVLENIWALYDTIVVRKDKPKIPVIAEKLGIKLTARDLRHTDGKIQLQAVMAQWLPLSRAVLEQICRFVKTCQVSAEKAERLMCSLNQNFSSFPPKTQELKLEFEKSSYASNHVIVFISKMFPVKRGQLPEYKSKILTQRKLEQLRKKTEIALAQMSVSAENPVNEDKIDEIVDKLAAPVDEEEEDEDMFIAFSRVYSGTLKRGMKIYVLGPKHDPRTIDPDNPLSSPYVSEIEVENLYILMGRELEPIDEVPAGNIVGISGLQNHILKNGTLSNNIYCPPFTDLTLTATPILRVSVEPQSTVDMPKLVKGLKLLNQADACVKVIMQETGELVLVTLGEVHLERCIKDLEETFAKIKLNVSEPIVPFRETIVPKSTVDMVNEAITESVDNIEEKIIEFSTRNKQCHARILAIPLPDSITAAIEDQSDILKALSNLQETKSLPEHTLRLLEQFKENLRNLFVAEKSEFFDETTVDKIWSLGPRKIGPNILLNLTDDYKNPKFWDATVENQATSNEIASDKRTVYEHSFVHGFQLASLTGPLCAEPLRGVCFIVYSWTYDDTIDSNEQLYGPLSGQIVSAVKEGCRKAFEKQPQRLVTPMYSCNIVVRSEALGNMYGIISRRHGRILAADLIGGSGSFSVTAVIPIIESYNFSQEFRTKTSGLAYPQLVFGHWEVVDIDPFWVPSTEEEYTHFGEKADTANRAKVYMDSVRKRKGLLVQEKTVEHAEKQRTLGKNK